MASQGRLCRLILSCQNNKNFLTVCQRSLSRSRVLSSRLNQNWCCKEGNKRWLSSTSKQEKLVDQQEDESKLIDNPEAKNVLKSLSEEVDFDDRFRENFVPLTRRSIIRHLVQDKQLLADEEKVIFENFALALDAAIVNKYHNLLEELKSLFDPINPDKDTIATRPLTRRERLDNEFWLLQKLSAVMSKANFHELPRSAIEQAMKQQITKEGVMVSVDIDKYDVLRVWALGKEGKGAEMTQWQFIMNKLFGKPPPKAVQYYKRAVVAIRLRRDDKLLLKAFKEVPIRALAKLMPDGEVSMSRRDRSLLGTMTTIAGLSVLAKIVTLLAHVHVDWMLLVTAATTALGIQSWNAYKNRHVSYVNELQKMLYFKNIANNRGLLALLMDRAEDEVFKEAMLVYTILLAHRPQSVIAVENTDDYVEASLSLPQLERYIEEWVFTKTNHKIEFESDDAVTLLKELGLVSEDYDMRLHALPLEAGLRLLPRQPHTLLTRVQEYDLVEGYDRHALDETEKEYKEEEEKRRKYGWF